MSGFRIINVFLLTVSVISLNAQSYEPLKINPPPVIDGILSENEWHECMPVNEFVTFIPDFDRIMENPTTAWMCYDSDNLYFAFKCYDKEPDKIKSSVNARDNIRPDDWVCINLDSFNDQQSLYAFYVNPGGIQMDSRFSAGTEDFSEDFVWFSAGSIDNDGYSVEMRIPLKSIRFSNREPVEMSIFFERFVSRTSEHASWPRLDPAKGYAFLSQMAPLTISGVKHYSLFELLPAFTYGYSNTQKDGNLTKENREPKLSLTAKYGITSQLILDATINPDFSQIESDAGQVDVNLRSQLYYSEKRPFFLEGNEIFNIAGESSSEVDPVIAFIHTRTIIDPLTGTKLTGKAGKNSTLGVLYALDRLPGDDSGNRSFAHFPVVRFKQKIGGENYLGFLLSARETEERFNRIAGVDGQIRIDRATMLGFNGFLSQTRVDKASAPATGHTAAIDMNHDSRNLSWSLTAKEVNTEFGTDAGFITRNGVGYVAGKFKPKFYPKSGFVRRIETELLTAQTHDSFYDMWETLNQFSLQAYMGRSSTLRVRYAFSTEIYLGESFKTGGLTLLASSQITKRFYLAAQYRKVNAIYYSSEPFQGYANKLTLNMNYKPTENLHLDASFTYNDLMRSDDDTRVYDYPIGRGKLTYQINKYLFLRAITEYNGYHNTLLTDFLASFTYIPGTVAYLGYGSLYEKLRWDGDIYVTDERYLEMKRGFFFKCSYLLRF